MKTKAKFYTFNQNNSGGHFDVNDRICEYVIIEAIDANVLPPRRSANGVCFANGLLFIITELDSSAIN